MKTAIIYSSRTGNTRRLAERVREALKAGDCVYFGEPKERGQIPEAELYCVGFWTDKGFADEQTRALLSGLEKKTVFLFGTAGFGADPRYFEQILERTTAPIQEKNRILPGFMCQGKMPDTVRARYEAMLEKDPGDERAGQFLKNFDAALGHPDSEDLERLAEHMKRIEQFRPLLLSQAPDREC